MYYDIIDTPLGQMTLVGDESALIHIDLPEARRPLHRSVVWKHDAQRFVEERRQFDRYFAGASTTFDLPLAMRGTPFQQEVWSALCNIRYGEAISYAELARRINRPKASRAVGLANGANPLAIIVPCHRVIGANGSLTGYGGGMDAKRWLLDLEQRHRPDGFALQS
ncbi:MAG: methylated-DNA--[protein]-cysteine S-methyltransferase [Dokdonella sp.]